MFDFVKNIQQQKFEEKISKAMIYFGITKKENNNLLQCYVYRLNILESVDLNENIKQSNISSLIIDIIDDNLSEYHQSILNCSYLTDVQFLDIIDQLLQYLSADEKSGKYRYSENLLLKQERAIIVYADVLWTFYTRFYSQFWYEMHLYCI